MLARIIFALLDWAARRGLAVEDVPPGPGATRQSAQRTGLRGETYAYWYLRRHGYILLARNYTAAGAHGEIDLIGYDGPTLAFIEVKTRTMGSQDAPKPEDAVTHEKRRVLNRIARRYLAEHRLHHVPWRFDVLAIENRPGQRPQVRLYKGAFS
ncbi:MAG: YraN family protein [Firmicutes bacterium]|nr:YraN family protein [Bacillota bacterium]